MFQSHIFEWTMTTMMINDDEDDNHSARFQYCFQTHSLHDNRPYTSLSQWTLKKKSLNFIFPTKYVIPKNLKFSHWPSKTQFQPFLLVGRFLIADAPGHWQRFLAEQRPLNAIAGSHLPQFHRNLIAVEVVELEI